VDRDRQWCAGATGACAAETPRAVSFCAHTLTDQQPLVVPDATSDPRFAGYPNVVGEPGIRFYAGAPIVDEDGYRLGALCVVDHRRRDISDSQLRALVSLAGQAAAQLALIRTRHRVTALTDELSRAGQREEELFATISHELRTPIASIQGYLEMLVDDDALAGYQRFIEPIQRNGDRLIRIVDHLVTGIRSAGAPLATPEGADLRTVVTTAIAACGQAGVDGVTVRRAPEAEPVIVRGDFIRLCQAVEQLLRNAILFTRPVSGGVTVRVSVDPPTIDIVDEGVGIPDDEMPHVFDRFYRGRYARDQAVPGVGLGLPIARGIIEAHRGGLTLTSTSHGTAVRVALPSTR
jgi:signal transduction histidine kinase